jgi:hypothetical protein
MATITFQMADILRRKSIKTLKKVKSAVQAVEKPRLRERESGLFRVCGAPLQGEGGIMCQRKREKRPE